MATQICPHCKADSFTWSRDDDSSLTYWGCSCGYSALEDEAEERECAVCYIKSESKMKDETKEYWWCSSCNRVTEIQ